jgi:prepilin-type processing-associated H-X9-DG protein/prepilin-type N-terminal cleavage/methylation domain-containing protein
MTRRQVYLIEQKKLILFRNNGKPLESKRTNPFGFTLVELLVVVSIVSILMGLLLPALGAARGQARGVVCRTQLRQLLLANLGYAQEHDSRLVPAASDMWDRAGRRRWHGTRVHPDAAFDPNGSPLAAYLQEGEVKECPTLQRFLAVGSWHFNFERGGGGYGYNLTYLGSRLWDRSFAGRFQQAYERTTSLLEVKRPAATLMFADTAMSQDGVNLIEYSFAEAPHAVYGGQVNDALLMSPSIHFRHRGQANIGWVDGHVEARQAVPQGDRNAYGASSATMGLGWFDPLDNTLFDLE